MTTLWIGICAVFGGLARYGLSQWLPTPAGFPLATLGINLVGAFILPLWTQWLGRKLHLSETGILAGGTGFCGAFTTFSTFSVEAMRLLIDQQWGALALYMGLSSFGGLALSLLAVTWAQHHVPKGVLK